MNKFFIIIIEILFACFVSCNVGNNNANEETYKSESLWNEIKSKDFKTEMSILDIKFCDKTGDLLRSIDQSKYVSLDSIESVSRITHSYGSEYTIYKRGRMFDLPGELEIYIFKEDDYFALSDFYFRVDETSKLSQNECKELYDYIQMRVLSFYPNPLSRMLVHPYTIFELHDNNMRFQLYRP